MPKPCPFCGNKLIKEDGKWRHPHWPGGNDRPCLLAGTHKIGDVFMHLWEKRAPLVWYEVVDGFPMFNVVGVGTPVTDAAMLQSFFDYLKEKAPGTGPGE